MVDKYSRNNHPSFSSTLLDAIYRSIDQGEEDMKTIRKKTEEEIANLHRARMIDKRPKPIRVCDSGLNKEKSASKINSNYNQDGLMKTKLRAYADLKKVKQPISPGARLAGFLNSLFAAAGSTKKHKKINNPPNLKSANASTCSSASSFSRSSCLSKTPTSRGKSAGGEKRSVSFSTLIVNDQDFHHRPPHQEMNVSRCKKQNLEAIVDQNDRRSSAARHFLRNYQENELRFDHLSKSHHLDQEFDDDDDAASYASSDLFELDNLSDIGSMERYREELPVYETTHLHTNRAIASGLIV